jgi:hypothetical protein
VFTTNRNLETHLVYLLGGATPTSLTLDATIHPPPADHADDSAGFGVDERSS